MIMKKAYIVRCAPSYISRVDEVLEKKQIIIGWSHTKDELFDKSLTRYEFKQKLENIYTDYKKNPYSLGQATGYLWRFIREMEIGDYAIVPIPKAFYVGRIVSNVKFLPEYLDNDTAIRREVEWLNEGKPVMRDFCCAGMVSRLKYQGTCVGASEFIEDIENSLILAKENKTPSFKNQLKENLKKEVSELLISKEAYLDDRKFEKLVMELMEGLGAKTSSIPSKSRYGSNIADVDVIANFVHLGIQVYVQVKKHSNESDEYAVKQVIEAIKHDNTDGAIPIIGWVITSANFSEEAERLANNNGIRVINGEELSEMIISVGLEKFN